MTGAEPDTAGSPAPDTPHGKALARAEAHEARLRERCDALAAELVKPFSARSPESVHALWQDIDALRVGLVRKLRDVRRAEGPPVRSGQTAAQSRDFTLLKRRRKAMERRSRMWPEIEAMVMAHVAPRPVALLPDAVPPPGDLLTEHLAHLLHKVANTARQSDAAFAAECFADIPLPVTRFEALMRAAYRLMLARGRHETVHFCDVGCGGGTKLALSRRFFAGATGLETDAGYADAARAFVARIDDPAIEVVETDALAFDGYAAFDVVYSFRPLRDPERLAALDRQIATTARAGTLLVLPHDSLLAPRPDPPGVPIAGCLSTVGLSEDEVATWRRDAERTGTSNVTRPETLEHEAGFWSPLLRASSFDLAEAARMQETDRHGR